MGNHKCMVCGKEFFCVVDLAYHIRATGHEGELNADCTMCPAKKSCDDIAEEMDVVRRH